MRSTPTLGSSHVSDPIHDITSRRLAPTLIAKTYGRDGKRSVRHASAAACLVEADAVLARGRRPGFPGHFPAAYPRNAAAPVRAFRSTSRMTALPNHSG